MTDPVPEEFGGLTPHLVVDDADAASRFYTDAFGADELQRWQGPDGRVWYCELLIAGSRVLMLEEFPDMQLLVPGALGGNSVMLHLYVPDADAVYARAIAAGSESLMDPTDAFWGDRYSQVRDPFGHRWAIASQREDVSPEDLGRRQAVFNRTNQGRTQP